MRIEHVALWTRDIESMRGFYETYFGAKSNEKYTNKAKGFESYFLRFDDGIRLELMRLNDGGGGSKDLVPLLTGFAHIAFSVGSKERVIELTSRLERDGFIVAGQPRTTGDGYFESVILDPENNRIEITE